MAEALELLRAALADRYRVDRELGSGGMATVYLAEDLKHHRRVAIKASGRPVVDLPRVAQRASQIRARVKTPLWQEWQRCKSTT